MIAVHCRKCHEELEEPGALVLGPPSDKDMAKKWHICSTCWNDLAIWICVNHD